MPPPRRLADLLAHLPGGVASGVVENVPVTGVAYDSLRIRPGEVFVAVPGTRVDGHAFLGDAGRRGAAAAVVERPPPEPAPIPLIRVPDARRALAKLAAAWYGHPAERLRLVGITGTVGKSTVLCMLEAIFGEAGQRIGTVGSFGVRIGGEGKETGFTVPDPLVLHRALADFVDAGCPLAAMEVTTHALDQERVHGVRYDLGVFTNLLPGEHTDYHGSFRRYADTKLRFLDHLRPGAPLVHSTDDRATRALAWGRRDLAPVGCGTGPEAQARMEALEIDSGGSRFRLVVHSPLPGPDGGTVPVRQLPIRLRVAGRAHARNAALAATTALCCGVAAAAIVRALATFPAPLRRTEVIHRGRFTVLDDTVYHPDSISALWEVVERLAPRRLHVVYAVRGQRGADTNRHAAQALAVWARRSPLGALVVTRGEGAAHAGNRVTDEEWTAFVAPLLRAGLPLEEHPRLEDAVVAALERAAEGDVLLLLGAQGMNGGAAIVRSWLERNHVAEHRQD